ncbi:hypothetical protein [Pseudoalteromonas obscura]|uniref:Uncharacterized protein n=1 Tax=Pseudoalteromonas obscura TaxID=3048491 RepID=A0ABT7EKP4_9GAMM|nr:hypothetical protein [Pseudoalteromonas sp. P94(2023)]MDK2595605.1 hypothetical protein [Pseudoalteromonas sp. P94(2023)]
MLKPISQVFIIIAMLIAFVGQAMAYNFTMSFEQASTSLDLAQASQTLADHSGKTGASETDDCCEVECCENDCVCPGNACVSLMYLSTDMQSAQVVKHSELVINIDIGRPIPMTDSLFRPPIFAS